MIALFFLGMIIGWFVITLILFLKAAKWKNNADGKIKIKRQWIFNFGILAWLFVSFWFAGGRIFYYDWQVDRMCAVDGGDKFYKKVKINKSQRLDDVLNYKVYDDFIVGSKSDWDQGNKGFIILKSTIESYLKESNSLVRKSVVYYRRGGCFNPIGLSGCSYQCPARLNFSADDFIIKE